jgi:hypothetical protein
MCIIDTNWRDDLSMDTVRCVTSTPAFITHFSCPPKTASDTLPRTGGRCLFYQLLFSILEIICTLRVVSIVQRQSLTLASFSYSVLPIGQPSTLSDLSHVYYY